jgi:urease accessory protein
MISPPVGHGLLELSHVAGKTEVTRCQAHSPLKLLTPRGRHEAAWVYTSTFGGGMVAGDQTELQVRMKPQARCVLTTQASSKIYRDPQQRGCRQLVEVDAESESLLVVAPDYVTCFAEASFRQQQDFRLDPQASLVVVDWLTSGRRSFGESWDFSRYQSGLNVHVDGQHVLSDTLLLDNRDGPIDGPFRLGRFHCIGLMLLVGPQVEPAARQLCEQVTARPVEPGAELIESVSEQSWGAVYRIAGISTEPVAARLRERLSFLKPLLGDEPWARKW